MIVDEKFEYLVERVFRVMRDIRKFGLLKDGFLFIDEFCVLVIEIGNVFGFVCMVCFGVMYYSINVVKFVSSARGSKFVFDESFDVDGLFEWIKMVLKNL